MLGILGDLLPYAVPAALSPLPVIAAVMMVLAPAGARGGGAFAAARTATLAVLTLVAALLAGELAGPPTESDRGGWLSIGLGCLLVVAAVVLWWRAPRADEATGLPGWLRTIDGATPARALWLGFLLTAANLKELALAAGAGMIIGAAGVPAGRVVALSTIFAALAGLGAAAPVVWAQAAGDAARGPLGAARDWLVGNQAIIMAAVLLTIGVMLIGSGLEAL